MTFMLFRSAVVAAVLFFSVTGSAFAATCDLGLAKYEVKTCFSSVDRHADAAKTAEFCANAAESTGACSVNRTPNDLYTGLSVKMVMYVEAMGEEVQLPKSPATTKQVNAYGSSVIATVHQLQALPFPAELKSLAALHANLNGFVSYAQSTMSAYGKNHE